MDEPDFERLEQIREDFFQRIHFFPEGCCRGAAVRINNVAGYKLVRGKFYFEGRQFDHYWNETPDGEIVDLTASQFSDRFPRIFVTSKHSDLAKNHYDNAYFRDVPI